MQIKNSNSQNNNKKIYDCFIFNNEYELLDLRLNEYFEHVDFFVIVEFSKTHTGFTKPSSNFIKYKSIWEKFSKKIIYQYVNNDEIPNSSNIRLNSIENFNRNYIDTILAKYAKKGDVIFISDLDEFWNTNHLNSVVNSGGICFFVQSLFYHYVNNRKNQLWVGTVKYNYGDFLPQDARNLAIKISNKIFHKSFTDVISLSNDTYHTFFKIICDGGNHYSWLSDFDKILQKKDNIYEAGDIKKYFIDLQSTKNKVDTGEDILNRKGWQFESIFLPRNSLACPPNKIDHFITKYPHFFKETNSFIIDKSVELIGLISTSIDLLKIMYQEMLRVKLKNPEWNIGFRIIANDASDEVINYLKDNNISHEVFKNKNPKEYSINRMYRAYNNAVYNSKYENVILVHPDMIFANNWFKNLVRYHNGVNIPVSRLIEFGNQSTYSWNLLSNCGNVFTTPINYKKLYKLEEAISVDKICYTGSYMPCIFSKKQFVASGGFPEGNVNRKGKVTTNSKKIFKTGDKWFFENVLRDKFKMNHITVYDSICYHFQEEDNKKY